MDLLYVIKDACDQDGQSQVAKWLGISRSYMNDIYHGRRAISTEVARKFGYTKSVVVTFEHIKKEGA